MISLNPERGISFMVPEGSMQVSKEEKPTTVLTRHDGNEEQQWPALHENPKSKAMLHIS